MKISQILLFLVVFSFLISPAIVAAQTCTTSADMDCDGSVNITELMNHIDAWYSCSACVPDLFQAIEAYYGISHASAYPTDYVSYWKLDSATGGITPDEAGRNDGTFMGDASITTDSERWQVLGLDGTDDYVDCEDDASLNFMDSLTLGAWIKPNTFGQSGWGRIVDKGSSSTGFSFFVSQENNNLGYAIYGVTVVYSNSNSISLNNWQHVAVSYDGSAVTFYVNGMESGTVSYTADPPDSSGHPLVIGIRDYDKNRDFDGLINDVIIYGRALTPTEISQIYESQKTGPAHPVCGDGTCSPGENCPQDAAGCPDNACYEPSCNSGCGQTAVPQRQNDETCVSPLMCDGAGSCVECTDNSYCSGDEQCVYGSCVIISTGCTKYVDDTGSGRACSSSNPCTLDYAKTNAVPGDIVCLRNGNYGEQSFGSGTAVGTQDAWITYQPATGEEPVFDRLEISGYGDYYISFIGLAITAPDDSAYTNLVRIIDAPSHLHLINCSITGRWDIPGPGALTKAGIGMKVYEVSDIVIDGCDVQKSQKGISTAGASKFRDGLIIRNNHIHNCASTLLYLDSDNDYDNGLVIVENNHIHDRRKLWELHGAGFYSFMNNIIIRNNIIHDYGGSGAIRLHASEAATPTNGYENVIIENNLVYDGQGTTGNVFHALHKNITIRNNTFRSGSGFGYPKPGASDIFIYNNIFAGGVSIDDSIDFTEDNNIWRYLKVGSNYLQDPPGENSIVIGYYGGYYPGYDENYFKGSVNFFSGGSDPDLFDQWGFDRVPQGQEHCPSDPDIPCFTCDPDASIGCSHKENLNDAYHPVMTSDACNGNVDSQGVAVGAFPCVCTENIQCEGVFGAGYTCNIETGECVEGNIYYLDASATGNNDGSSWQDAWNNLADAKAVVNNLPDEDITVLVRDGNYGYYSDSTARTDWLTWKAGAGASPEFTGIRIGGTGFNSDVYLRFEDIHFIGFLSGASPPTPTINNNGGDYVEIINCEVEGYANPDGYNKGYWDAGSCVWLVGDHLKISGCEVHDCHRGIELVQTDYPNVDNIEEISYNYVHDCSGSGILIFDEAKVNISYNHVYRQWPYPDPDLPHIHGSGIGIEAEEVIIRHNIVHGYGNSGGINFYNSEGGSYGHNNIVENNLVYDGGAIGLGAITSGCKCNNNTIIGHGAEDQDGVSGTGPRRYSYGGINFRPSSGYVGDLEFYNNVVVGLLGNTQAMNINAGGNIVWAYEYPEPWQYSDILENSIVVQPTIGDPDYFESGFFIQDPINFSWPNSKARGEYCNQLFQDFHPLMTSPACDGSINGQPGVAWAGALPCA